MDLQVYEVMSHEAAEQEAGIAVQYDTLRPLGELAFLEWCCAVVYCAALAANKHRLLAALNKRCPLFQAALFAGICSWACVLAHCHGTA